MRPYRSHRIPACDRCRRQKRRCIAEEHGRSCMLCRVGGKTCSYSARTGGKQANPPKKSREVDRTPRAGDIPRIDGSRVVLEAQSGEAQGRRVVGQGGQDFDRTDSASEKDRSLETSDSVDHSSMIVSPVITEDVQVLDNFMTPKPNPSPGRAFEQPHPNTPDKSVLYLSVPRRREGLAIAENPGAKQWNILSNLLMSSKDELSTMYFERIHPSFPFLDEEVFLTCHTKDSKKPSAALLCEFYALSLTQWHNAPKLNGLPQPDPEFIWNLAVEALQEDYLAPAISTVYAAVLEMLGRPIFSVVGNAINNGRTVVLANSLGLHRDPTHWNRPRRERNARVRLWWAVLIQDRWSSFAHGISPNVTKNHYDVPIPLLENLMTEGGQTDERVKGGECFIQLCKLTEILGDVLPLVYDLSSKHDRLSRDSRRLETELDSWDCGVPSNLKCLDKGHGRRVAGSSNLRLCYLAVRLLVYRISLRAAGMVDDIDRQESQRYHLSRLRRSAQDIVDFICSLNQSHLQEFWLPYTAHFLTFTVVILLRSTIESVDSAVIQSCKLSLDQLWGKLHQAAVRDKWDLANICIQRCQESYNRVTASVTRGSSQNLPNPPSKVCGDDANLRVNSDGDDRGEVLPDLLPFANPDMSFESGDNSWDALWFGMDETWNQVLDGVAMDAFQP